MGDALRLSKSVWQDTEFGKIPGYWETETIGALSENVTDGSHFSPKPHSVGKYMCSVKDMTYNRFDFSNCKLISQNDFDKLVAQGCKPEKNDILISKDGANCLDLIFVFDQEEDLVLLSSIAIVRLLPNIDPKFVCYFLLSPTCQYVMRNNYVSGSAIPRVVLKDFKKISIFLPPLPEQRAIASVLSSLDDKIDLLHRQNKTLEAMGEILFREWFVEEANEGGEECTLNDLCTQITSGGTPSTKIESYYDGNINWYSTKELKDNFLYESENKITKEGLENSSAKLFPAGTVVIAIYAAPTVGRLGILANEASFNQAACGLIANEEFCCSGFIYLYLKNQRDELNLMASGSAQQNLNVGKIKSFPAFKVPKDLMEKFKDAIQPNFKKINSNTLQIRTLEKLRDTLLPKLMSGEVRVECEEYE